jgi:MinD superfamily P-loop ATPase
LILTDGPPGIGCPVIASIGGASGLVIVVEPTVSGLHDMQRVVELAAHFKVPGMICINKYDLNLEMTENIERYAEKRNIKLLGRIPFDPRFVKAMNRAENILEYAPDSQVAGAVVQIWEEILTSPSMDKMGIVDLAKVIS